jgi:hypothetical protein
MASDVLSFTMAQPKGSRPADPITLVGVVERLLAGAAVAGATIYVLINALYIEFYDDFGVRPEDVGLDRVAVLGRAAWVALVGIIVGGLFGYLYMWITALRRIRATRRRVETHMAEGKRDTADHPGRRMSDEEIREEVREAVREEFNQEVEEEARKARTMARFGLGLLAFTVLILIGFYFFDRKVEAEAVRVRQGLSVDGIDFLVPLSMSARLALRSRGSAISKDSL